METKEMLGKILKRVFAFTATAAMLTANIHAANSAQLSNALNQSIALQASQAYLVQNLPEPTQTTTEQTEITPEPTQTALDAKIKLSTVVQEFDAPIEVNATFSEVYENVTCTAEWILNDELLSEYTQTDFLLSNESTLKFLHQIEYSPYMRIYNDVALRLTYSNPESGIEEVLEQNVSVTVKNYNFDEYTEKVFAKISSEYVAGLPDYEQWEKNVFINAKDYTSPTGQLVWVNKATQTVNIFYSQDNSWHLYQEFECATGAYGSGTPVGVTYITYKQSGWFLPSYDCLYVTRFYPNTGYAFHSQPMYPDTLTPKYPEMGEPASAGCIRMLVDDSQWLHENIPENSTVVIF